MITYIMTDNLERNDEFMFATTDIKKLLKELLKTGNEIHNFQVYVLTEDDRILLYQNYLEEEEKNQNKCIDISKLSLEELPADILAKRLKALDDYIDEFEGYSDATIIQRMRNIINIINGVEI